MNWDAGAVVRVAFIAGREDRAHPAIRLSTLNSDAATNKCEDGNFMQTASPLQTWCAHEILYSFQWTRSLHEIAMKDDPRLYLLQHRN